MSYPIIVSSPQALAKINPNVPQDAQAVTEKNVHHRTKYPIDALHVGYSFTVPLAEANEASLRLTASARGKKTGKKFCVIKHREFNCIEVARIG